MTLPSNFMAADLLATLAAVVIYPLFVVVPGYVSAWFLELFDFRKRTALFRLALSVPLSISACPIVTYLLGRYGSMPAVWALFAAEWICFAILLGYDLRLGALSLRIPREWWVFAAIAAGWMVLALFSSVDLQFGGKDYFPTIALDYSVRTQFIQSIGTSGVPPGNPFFFPGHAVPLRYHYFWLLVCSMVDQAGGSLVGPRRAWMGGTIWCGFGFMGLIALYFRLFWYRGPATFRRRTLAAILLVCATGLDIVPTAFLWLLRASGIMHAVFPSMEFWNEQVDGFVWTAIWTAHHLAGVIACFMVFLLLSRKRVVYGLVAGIALASSAGLSVYVCFVFAMFLLVWTGICAAKREWGEVRILALTGCAALLLFIPYGLNLTGAGSGGPPVEFWVRPFHPADAIFKAHALSALARGVLNGALLPVNYILELGFFLAAAVVWWKRRRRTAEPLSRAELAIATMVGTSILICTFVRSSVIGNNDLGWRGFLIAQFGLMLWGVDVFAERLWPKRAILGVTLALGLAGSAYDLLILRTYPVLADHGIVAPVPWMAMDGDLGRRNYATREAYEWVARKTPRTSILQFDPHTNVQDTSAFLYANRQFAAGDEYCLTAFGGDPSLCPVIVAKLRQIYPPPGAPVPPDIEGVCRALPIDIVIAKDNDRAWSDRQGWVWREKPMFSNPYVRVFGCRQPAAANLAAR